MIFKGREELEVKSPSRVLAQQVEAGWKKHDLANQVIVPLQMVLLQHKQRHHLVCSLERCLVLLCCCGLDSDICLSALQIADYLTRVETMRKAEALGSPFLSAFYAGRFQWLLPCLYL